MTAGAGVGGTGPEHLLFLVLVQLVVIIAAARVFGALFRRMGQPAVCGEIAAGLVLGPSLFGGLFPGFFEWVFDPAVEPVMGVVARMGLVLLLFLVGLDFDFGHLRTRTRAPVAISLGGLVAPFALGLGVAHVLYPRVGEGVDPLAFYLFIAAAMCITALPILGRILIEFRLNRTRLGAVTISAAAVDDVAGWVLLALVTSIARAEADLLATLRMVALTVLFGFAMVKWVRPLAHRWATRTLQRSGGDLSPDALAAVLVSVFAFGIATHQIGIFAIFGAFLFGAIMHDHVPFRDAVLARLNEFVTVFFLPIFFTYTGLRTDIGSVRGVEAWALCGLVLFGAVVGKFGGSMAAARMAGMSWRESAAVGTMMNTRALMELIVINVGYDLGIISRSVFFMLVFMAIVTTYMTAPLLHLLRVAPPVPRHPAAPPPVEVREAAVG